MRFAIAYPPEQAEEHARNADDEEQRAPAERPHDPEQQRAQEGEPDILADRIDAGRECALLLREPGRHHTAVGRKARRFAHAEGEAKSQQRREVGRNAVQQGRQRPEGQRKEIRQLGAEAVEEDPARDLHRGVSPRERRKYDAHRRRIDREFSTQRRRRDAEHGTVEIVDHRADGQQGQYEVAHARARRRLRLQSHFPSPCFQAWLSPQRSRRTRRKTNYEEENAKVESGRGADSTIGTGFQLALFYPPAFPLRPPRPLR